MKTKVKNPPKQRNRKHTKEVTRGSNAICIAAKEAANANLVKKLEKK